MSLANLGVHVRFQRLSAQPFFKGLAHSQLSKAELTARHVTALGLVMP